MQLQVELIWMRSFFSKRKYFLLAMWAPSLFSIEKQDVLHRTTDLMQLEEMTYCYRNTKCFENFCLTGKRCRPLFYLKAWEACDHDRKINVNTRLIFWIIIRNIWLSLPLHALTVMLLQQTTKHNNRKSYLYSINVLKK